MVKVKKSGTTSKSKTTPKSNIKKVTAAKSASKASPKVSKQPEASPKASNVKSKDVKSTPKASPKVVKKVAASPKSTTSKSKGIKATSSNSVTSKSKGTKVTASKAAAASKALKEMVELVDQTKEADVSDKVTTPAKSKASKKTTTPQKSTTSNNSVTSTPAKSTPKRKAATSAASPAKKTKVGDDSIIAPEKTVPEGMIIKDHTGTEVNLYQLAKETGLIIFTYPAASTPGCTKQVGYFRDAYETFIKKGYQVFGLSGDASQKNLAFYNKQKLNYPLLSDPEAKLIKFLGANRGKGNKAIRSVFVIGKGGKLMDSKINVGPEPSKDWALDVIA